MDIPKKPNRRLVPSNVGLLDLIRAKREWDWKPSVEELQRGFRGWHQRGYLPHFDAPHITQFVTVMLADSFPITRRAEWEPFLHEQSDSEKRKQLEAWLDRGHGECWLKRDDVAAAIEEIILKNDGKEYRMQAWVVMPNHVHAVIDVWDIPLTTILHDWKGASARIANQLLKRRGAFWQEDYFDTVVRDAGHLQKSVKYTENNPTKAILCQTPRDWKWSSAWRRDKYERLPWQQAQKERGF